MRDLEYPSDARKAQSALIKGLEYAAAFAAFGASAQEKENSNPTKILNLSTGVKFGDEEADAAVKRDIALLCSRYAFIAMVSHFDQFTKLLLLQRRFLEETKDGGRLDSEAMWTLLKRVNGEMRRQSLSAVVTRSIVTNPSGDLLGRSNWLTGISRVRHCIAHRLGLVQLEDVKPEGVPFDQIKETDRFTVSWLRPRVFVDGKEITSFPYTHTGKNTGDGQLRFEEEQRSWEVGEIIHIDPLECQGIAMTLTQVANLVLREFEQEMNVLLNTQKK